MDALPTSLSAQSFPCTPACPGQCTHRSFRRWMSTIDTFRSWLSIPLFPFSSKLIESVKVMACVVWLSPPEEKRWRAWVTSSMSIVKLKVETVQAALSSWMVVASCLTVKTHPDWSLVTEPLVYNTWSWVCCFIEWKLDLWFCFACWPLPTVLSQVFWQGILIETPESFWVPFPLLGLLELCQQAYL